MPENVWDYPRPPALEPVAGTVRVELSGELVAESARALRVLETSHPPTVYIHPEDIAPAAVTPSGGGGSLCEWKGRAVYWDVGPERRAGWSYPQPVARYAALRDHVAFYPSRLDCFLHGERVRAQAGDFYGGWIYGDIVGPFKGAAGTEGW